jgi:isoquinoline 1-oxidoreductase subunit beta
VGDDAVSLGSGTLQEGFAKIIAVHIIEGVEKPTSVGESPIPPFIPALCNAIDAATGKRIKQSPIKLA